MEGRGCGGDGGVGPTRVSYLHGPGAVGGTGARDTVAAAEGGATIAAIAGSVVGGGVAAAGGKDGLTRGL